MEDETKNRTEAIERINAFLDGELDRKAQARLMDDVAADPALARELSMLSHLKEALDESVDCSDLNLEIPAHRKSHPALWTGLAVAAGLVLMLAGGALWQSGSPVDGDVPISWAVKAHRSWNAPYPQETSPVLRPASVRVDAVVPDLSANGLAVSYVGTHADRQGDDALLVGYRGTRGCKVTLLVLSSALSRDLSAEGVRFETKGVIAAAWITGRLDYFVLAESMAGPRFRLVAASIRKASMEHLPFDRRTRLALVESRRESLPCQTG
ncbi:MAG: anti-sigma factor family protein [Alphaproteobacteria bacterium]